MARMRAVDHRDGTGGITLLLRLLVLAGILLALSHVHADEHGDHGEDSDHTCSLCIASTQAMPLPEVPGPLLAGHDRLRSPPSPDPSSPEIRCGPCRPTIRGPPAP